MEGQWNVVEANDVRRTIITFVKPNDQELPSNEHCNAVDLNNTYYSDCNTATLNELVGFNFNITEGDLYDHNVVLLPGKHIVNATLSESLVFHGKRARRVSFVGKDNVHIICTKKMNFGFVSVEWTTISNVHFENCSGKHSSSGQDYTLVFQCSRLPYSECIVTIHNIEIVNTINGGGIYTKFGATASQSFTLSNSNISTGDIGLHIFMSGNAHRILVRRVNFHHSCFILEGDQNSYVYIIQNVRFYACTCPTALSVKGYMNIVINNTNFGAITSRYIIHSTAKSLTLKGQCYFYRNRGVVLIKSDQNNIAVLSISQATVGFIDSTVGKLFETLSSMMVADSSKIDFINSNITFKNNHGKDCGGIAATNKAVISFQNSNIEFVNNYGEQGGAMALYSMSVLAFRGQNNSTIIFANNTAQKGGAIFIDDNGYLQGNKWNKSVLDLHGTGKSRFKRNLRFFNNSAKVGGDNIYGGWLDWSIDDNNNVKYKSKVFSYFLSFQDDKHGIASDPTRVCMCVNNIENCNETKWDFEVYPGQTISVNAVAVGQRYGTVITRTRADLKESLTSGTILSTETIQRVQRSCANSELKYTLRSPNKVEKMSITVLKNTMQTPPFERELLKDYPFELGLLFEQLTITFHLKECPLGFLLHKECVCSPSLESHGLTCNISTHTK